MGIKSTLGKIKYYVTGAYVDEQVKKEMMEIANARKVYLEEKLEASLINEKYFKEVGNVKLLNREIIIRCDIVRELHDIERYIVNY